MAWFPVGNFQASFNTRYIADIGEKVHSKHSI